MKQGQIQGFGGQNPPFWGTQKLQKEGKMLTRADPPFLISCIRPCEKGRQCAQFGVYCAILEMPKCKLMCMGYVQNMHTTIPWTVHACV